MEPHQRLTPRERLQRILLGLVLVAVGCLIFHFSKTHDPDNRWAIVGIVAIIVGFSWAGPGVRGYRETTPSDAPRETPGDAPAMPAAEAAATGDPQVSPERMVGGLLLAFLVPGGGHWLLGKRKKAALLFVTITACFLAGAALAQGRNFDYDREWIYFIAYMFNAGETLLAVLLTSGLELDHTIPYLQVGFLYSAVGGLLNLVAAMDFVSTCYRPAPSEEDAHAEHAEHAEHGEHGEHGAGGVEGVNDATDDASGAVG
jgi:hypothetical protein